jgi:D-alanyl-D-alanine carboxypeptidase/D-alanyl-D-alanine-endopeptidase (penicillin-binding protein 4)
LVAVLQQMKTIFGMARIAAILPTANAGTLSGHYKNFAGNLLAKTGTLSNHVSISGFVTTASGKPIIFSVLVNNHVSSAAAVRNVVEKYLTAYIQSN